MVMAHGRVLAIEPASEPADVAVGKRARHSVRKLDGEEILKKRAAISRFVHGAGASSDDDGARRLVGETKKTVELLLVSDHARYTAFGGASGSAASQAHALGVVNAAAALYRAPPESGTFGYEIDLAVVEHITFTDKDPWADEVEKNGDAILVESLLSLFGSWGQAQLVAGKVASHDNRMLISGSTFDGNTAGLAYIGTMCKQSYSTNLGQCLGTGTDALPLCGVIVAHELGHNLGMRHDGEDNACEDGKNIMSVSTVASADAFSKCSTQYVTDFFAGRYAEVGECLENAPTSVKGDPVCGNGFVEKGEDCDSGSQNSTDPCCGDDCKFSDPSYQCSGGACCDSCMFVGAAARRVCRASRGSCDIEEYCAGDSPTCPVDRYRYPGMACSEGGIDGLCFEGGCSSLQSTCVKDITPNFPGNWDSSEGCARHADSCNRLVCHKKGEDDHSCGQAFEVHGKQLFVPDGTPCLFAGYSHEERQGMCFDGTCMSPHSLSAAPFCGNGGIEVGEQCDCGVTDDPCCDCATCQLKAGKECSSLELCCTAQCTFKPAGETCREATGECDVAETCTGTAGHCPADVGAVWGTPCDYTAEGRTARSTCYGKTCLRSLDHQCAQQTAGARPFAMRTLEGTTDPQHQCTALACCSACTQQSGTFDFDGKVVTNPVDCAGCGRNEKTSTYKIGAEQHTIWMTAPVNGAVLSDPSMMCIDGKQVKGISSQDDCPAMHYLERSVGECVPCDPGCEVGCLGPTNLDCDGRCRWGVDGRGACAFTELQAESPHVTDDKRVFPEKTTTAPADTDDSALIDGAAPAGPTVAGVFAAVLVARHAANM